MIIEPVRLPPLFTVFLLVGTSVPSDIGDPELRKRNKKWKKREQEEGQQHTREFEPGSCSQSHSQLLPGVPPVVRVVV